MQTRALATLLEISQVGSFARAAQALNMTLSAVSMQIKALEQELGVDLFDRSFRPPKMTPEGRAVCRHAVQIVATERALKQECAVKGEPFGTVHMGFVMTASVRLLPTFLLNAKRRYPKIAWEISNGLSEGLEAEVLAGRLDGAVVTASEEPKAGLHYTVLRREPLRFAIPSELADVSMDIVETRLPFLHFAPASGVGKLIAKHARRHRYTAGQTIVLENIEGIMQCVNKGVGFSLLPLPDIERYRSDGTEVRAMPGGEGLAREIVLAVREDARQTLNSSALVSLFDHPA